MKTLITLFLLTFSLPSFAALISRTELSNTVTGKVDKLNSVATNLQNHGTTYLPERVYQRGNPGQATNTLGPGRIYSQTLTNETYWEMITGGSGLAFFGPQNSDYAIQFDRAVGTSGGLLRLRQTNGVVALKIEDDSRTTFASNVAATAFTSLAGGNAVDANGNLYATNSTGIAGGGSSGPTTNAPPYTIAINGGLGSTNIVLDMLALGPTNVVRATLTANTGLIVTNVIDGMSVTLELIQDSTGNRGFTTNATWGFNVRFGIDVTGFAITTNASTKDLVRLLGSGTNALVVGNLRGFSL